MKNPKYEELPAEETQEASNMSESISWNAHLECRDPMGLTLALPICLVGWLLPGAAHVVLGRWGRGLILGLSVIIMFILGILMEGRLYDMIPEQLLHIFAFLANVGIGAPYIFSQNVGYGVGVLSSPNYDYGTTFLWVSGLLNYLIVIDAFDISQGRKP